MVHVLVWAAVLLGTVLWCATAWGFHALGAWSLAQADAISLGSAAAWRLPQWLALWIPADLQPAITATLQAMAPAFEAALAWAPHVADEFTTVVWAAWGLGTALLVVTGLLLSGLASAMQRRARRGGRSSPCRNVAAGDGADWPPTWTPR
jgi:hypothetical protein